jgi:cytochrome P450
VAGYDDVNYMSAEDESLIQDPYPYYDHLRQRCPVTSVENLGVLAVSGYDELATVQRDTAHYSSANCLAGMFAPIEIPEGCEDLGPIIEEARASVPKAFAPLATVLVSLDPPVHTQQRGLLKRIFSPRRLRENEEFMTRLATEQLDTFVEKGSCELYADYAKPFTNLVVADLLGVPESDHRKFHAELEANRVPLEEMGNLDETAVDFVQDWFTGYVEERRKAPREDVLTLLADSKYPDGSTPEPEIVGRLASFLFAAGSDTTAALMMSGMRVLCEQPDLQDRLRRDPERIPDFVEEALRFDGVVKTTYRLARRHTQIDELDIPIGTTLMLLLSGANRDPRRFPNPNEFDVDRPNSREHVAFGRGPHACAGAPLARTEARVTFAKLLERMEDIRLSEAHHGPEGDRRYEYEPSYILRRLLALHLEFTPTG